MKGQAEVTEVILIIAMIATTFFVVINILPMIMDDLGKMLALASGEVVARDISGLTTISGAAPYSIKIFYAPEVEEISYNVEMRKRMVAVDMVRENKECVGTFCKGEGKSAVGNLNKKLQGATQFTITKSVDNNYNVESS